MTVQLNTKNDLTTKIASIGSVLALLMQSIYNNNYDPANNSYVLFSFTGVQNPGYQLIGMCSNDGDPGTAGNNKVRFWVVTDVGRTQQEMLEGNLITEIPSMNQVFQPVAKTLSADRDIVLVTLFLDEIRTRLTSLNDFPASNRLQIPKV